MEYKKQFKMYCDYFQFNFDLILAKNVKNIYNKIQLLYLIIVSKNISINDSAIFHQICIKIALVYIIN